MVQTYFAPINSVLPSQSPLCRGGCEGRGHADAIGSDDYNQRLSERRAHSVGSALMDFGVDYGRIETSGRGEWEPIASNDSEWGRARNRRVEIHLKPSRK